MKPVLLLVDLQADHLATPHLHPPAEAVVTRAADLLDYCRRCGVPIVHAWTTIHRGRDRRLPHWELINRWMCVAGTTGHEPPSVLVPQAGEIIVHKTGFNAFAGGALDAALRRFNCNAVIVAGVQLHACVRSVATESLERGLEVVIAEDATGSNDPVHAAAVRRWLVERCVRFEPVNALRWQLAGTPPSSWTHRSPRVTRKVLFKVPLATADEIAAATAAAENAGASWRRKPLHERQQILEKLAKRLDAAAPDLARQMAVEIGKPLSHGLEEVRRAAGNVRDIIQRAAAFAAVNREAAGLIRHQPLGVVALISPWNNPVAIPIGKIAPALIYDNAVVWKPAPAATRIAAATLKLLREAGVSPNAVRLVTGDHTTAQRLASDERIDAVTFTGSALGGFAIQEICTRRFVPLQAELNGNNAAIVWDDADFPDAAAQIAWAAFGFAGQRCTANRRVIVPQKSFETFWRHLKVAAEKLVWSDPLKKSTDIGPVLGTAKRDEQNAALAIARESGAADRLDLLFKRRAREPWVRAGAYAQPAIVACNRPKHSLVQEETMSPLLIVQRADGFEHALELCNGVRHGLVAALFSRSSKLQQKFLVEARAGILKLNSATAGVAASLPFGGWKASGIGPPEHGEADRHFYTRTQTIYE